MGFTDSLKEKEVDKLRKLAEDGNVPAQRIIRKYNNDFGAITLKEVIGLVLVCIVIGYVFPIGLTSLAALMNVTGLDAGTMGLLSVFPIIIVIVVFMKITE